MTRHRLCRRDALSPGVLVPAQAGRMPVVVTLVDGEPVAIAARCPHQGADLGYGTLCARVETGADGTLTADPARPVLRCPWHGFEFDIQSGEAIVAPPAHLRLRLRRFAATVDGDHIVVDI